MGVMGAGYKPFFLHVLEVLADDGACFKAELCPDLVIGWPDLVQCNKTSDEPQNG